MSTMANGLAQHPSNPLPQSSPPDGFAAPDRPVVPPVADRPAATNLPKKPTHLSRTQILDATEVCLETEGYDGTTIRRIARELNCAVGSIYRYFKDKRELLGAVTQRRFEPVQTAFEAGMALDQVLRMYARIANEQPEQYRLMFWLASVGQNQVGRHLPEIVEHLIGLWANRVGDRRQAELQWAQLHGNLMLGLVSRDTPTETPAAPAPANVTAAATTPSPSSEDLTLL